MDGFDEVKFQFGEGVVTFTSIVVVLVVAGIERTAAVSYGRGVSFRQEEQQDAYRAGHTGEEPHGPFPGNVVDQAVGEQGSESRAAVRCSYP